MRSVTATSAIRTVIMNASNAFVPMAQRTSQTMRPKVIATMVPMTGANGSGRRLFGAALGVALGVRGSALCRERRRQVRDDLAHGGRRVRRIARRAHEPA